VLRKVIDYKTRFRRAGGIGFLREEVWVDSEEKVVRYNLALIVPHVSSIDNGRILGFDNAHGNHERHYLGEVRTVQFKSYEATANRFYREAESIRRKL
jgi:hypothetical protein